MPQFRNVVFDDGAVKGIAYAGAIRVLEEKRLLGDIRRVAGTSAGAITAALLAVGTKGKGTKTERWRVANDMSTNVPVCV